MGEISVSVLTCRSNSAARQASPWPPCAATGCSSWHRGGTRPAALHALMRPATGSTCRKEPHARFEIWREAHVEAGHLTVRHAAWGIAYRHRGVSLPRLPGMPVVPDLVVVEHVGGEGAWAGGKRGQLRLYGGQELGGARDPPVARGLVRTGGRRLRGGEGRGREQPLQPLLEGDKEA